MSRAVRITNILVVVLPFIAFVAALATLWNAFVSPRDLAIGFVMYAITILGVTIGFHRYLTHRSFSTSKPVEYALAILGSMAIEGPVVNWVADHRKHHAHTDEEGDPHSPHGHGSGLTGTVKGLWHAPDDHRVLPGPGELRRGLATQPPRVSPLGVPRPSQARDRPRRLGDRRDGEARARVGRRAHHARAPSSA